jgi:hypothetical protein
MTPDDRNGPIHINCVDCGAVAGVPCSNAGIGWFHSSRIQMALGRLTPPGRIYNNFGKRMYYEFGNPVCYGRALLVECPLCGARPDVPCSGSATGDHLVCVERYDEAVAMEYSDAEELTLP